TTIAGVRTISPVAEPVPPYKKAAGLRGWRRRAGLLVLLPASPPEDEEDQEPHDRDDDHNYDPREQVQEGRRDWPGGDDGPGRGEGLWAIHRDEDDARRRQRVPGPSREPVRCPAHGDGVGNGRGRDPAFRIPAPALRG